MEPRDREMQAAPRTPRDAAPEVPAPPRTSRLGATALSPQQRRAPHGHPRAQGPPSGYDAPTARAPSDAMAVPTPGGHQGHLRSSHGPLLLLAECPQRIKNQVCRGPGLRPE
eukprot:8127336-Pyramimonas_sp.AAC.1